jgi:hypothetical protein
LEERLNISPHAQTRMSTDHTLFNRSCRWDHLRSDEMNICSMTLSSWSEMIGVWERNCTARRRHHSENGMVIILTASFSAN